MQKNNNSIHMTTISIMASNNQLREVQKEIQIMSNS